ncbi:MAG: hypothetical protein O7A04_03830 [Acidobacteria bacterium]|nr:hypothetical protein [Acidobacteriota bacterium]
MMLGKVAHSIFENLVLNPDALAVEVADATVIACCSEGMSFEGGAPEFPTVDEALAARRLVLRTLDRFDLPAAEYRRAELEVNLSPVDWRKVEGEKCVCLGRVELTKGAPMRTLYASRGVALDKRISEGWTAGTCSTCGGSGEVWPVHWHQLLDLVAQGPEEDAYGDPVSVATGLDHKGWNAGPAWFESIQGIGYAVALATLFPEADILRRMCVPYQMGRPIEDLIDLREEEDRQRLEDYRTELGLSIEAGQAMTLDVEASARPGPGCFAGFGDTGCPYFLRCEPALRRSSELCREGIGVRFGTIQLAAEAWALGSALQQEAREQLKGQGGGPVEIDGHNVGWQDTSKPDGKVTKNAPMILAREYAAHILSDVSKAEMVEGALRTAGVGHNGAGVSVVRKYAKKLGAAFMDRDEIERMLQLCLEPKTSRALKVWRGPLPAPVEDDLEKALRVSIEAAKNDKIGGPAEVATPQPSPITKTPQRGGV